MLAWKSKEELLQQASDTLEMVLRDKSLQIEEVGGALESTRVSL